MIGTIRISQLPLANGITGNETVIVNQDGDTRRTTVNAVVGIVTYVESSGIATYATTAGIATYANIAGISTISQGLTGIPNIVVGVVTATEYYGDGSKLSNIISGVGIQSSGTIVGSGITTLNFIGAGNTFSVSGSTVNISIQGGGGSSQWVTTSSGIHTTSNVGIATTNPIQRFQVGAAGTNVFVVDASGDVGIGTTNPTTKLHVTGDINLDDGGSFTTTLQTVTPTANRTISFPDATGTLALISGSSSGQLLYNNAGALGGVSTMTFDGTSVTLAGRLINSYTSLASSPAKHFTGTWFSGGTATTTKPHVLIEPSGTTSTAWSTSGTGLGINAASGFAGNLLDLQLNGAARFTVAASGTVTATSDIVQKPSASITPTNNGQLVIEATSNTSVTIKLKGSDGTVRSVALTLA